MGSEYQLQGVLTKELTVLRRRLSLSESSSFDLKRLDALIGELENMLHTLRDHSRESVIIVQNDRLVYSNTAAVKVTGYSHEELLDMPIQSLLIPNLRDKVAAREKMILAGDCDDSPFEWIILRKDRTQRVASVIGSLINFIERPAVIYYFIDITESKKVEVELEMKERVLDFVADSILLLQIDGKIEYVNESACCILGYTRDELLAMNVLEIISPDVRNRFNVRLKQFSEKVEACFDTVHLCKDGTCIPVRVRGLVARRGKQPLLMCVWHELYAVTAAQ